MTSIPMFITKQPVGVSDEDGNVIYIRAKMDFGTRNKVIGEATRVQLPGSEPKGGKRLVKGKRPPGKQKAAPVTNLDVGAYQTALLVHNVLDWEGPDFDRMPCTEENLRALNPDHPLLKKVLDEIAERNPKPDEDEDEESGEIEGKSTLVG